MRTNEERGATGYAVLRGYAAVMAREDEDYTTNLIDLLTDLRHTFTPEAFAKALRTSETHYNAEIEEEEQS